MTAGADRPKGDMPSAEVPSSWTVGDARVEVSTDAGAYYCAHLLFLLQATVNQPQSSVRTNAHGERLAGFLHVPADTQTQGAAALIAPLERHARTGAVVAAALRGYLKALGVAAHAPHRILLSGFGAFGTVADNPTGAFVAHAAATSHAIGRATGRTPSPLPPLTEAAATLERLGDSSLEVGLLRLPVVDGCLSGAPGALQWALARFAPHAVLCMGVHRAATYQVEVRATSAGLSSLEPMRHDPTSLSRTPQERAPSELPSRALPAVQHLPDNRALAEAIVLGSNGSQPVS